MAPETKELLQKLDEAEWFASVGQPLDEGLRASVIAVASWSEAIACCASDEWSNFALEQRNLLTMFLHTHALERYRRWNHLVVAVKDVVNPLIERKLLSLADRLDVPPCLKVVRDAARWDLLGACMELEYADVRQPGYFRGLMFWYLSGRIPCGWGDRDEGGALHLYGPVYESGYEPNEPDWLKLVFANQERVIHPKVTLPSKGHLLVY
jgi:hypothetical protein